MRSPTQREWVLLGLLSAVAIVVLYVQSGGISGRAGRQQAADSTPLGEAPVVHLERLALASEDYDPAGRNLFVYGPPPAVRRATAPPPKAPPPRPPAPPPPRQAPPRTAPPAPRSTKPTPPKPNFKYLGYLGPKENRIAVFEPAGGPEETMLLAGMGDVVQRDFRLLEFRYETVVFGYTDDQFADQTTELTIQGKSK